MTNILRSASKATFSTWLPKNTNYIMFNKHSSYLALILAQSSCDDGKRSIPLSAVVGALFNRNFRLMNLISYCSYSPALYLRKMRGNGSQHFLIHLQTYICVCIFQGKWKKKCEPFVTYLINSTANPAQLEDIWAQLAVLFSRKIANGSHDFDFFNFLN